MTRRELIERTEELMELIELLADRHFELVDAHNRNMIALTKLSETQKTRIEALEARVESMVESSHD